MRESWDLEALCDARADALHTLDLEWNEVGYEATSDPFGPSYDEWLSETDNNDEEDA